MIINPHIFGGAPVLEGGQALSTNSTASLSTSATRFLPVGYSATPAGSDGAFFVFSAPGTLDLLRVNFPTAPTGAATWTVTLMKNGVATALACTVDSSSSGGGSASGAVSFAAGDYASLRIVPSASPAPTASRASVSLVFMPSTAGVTLIAAYGTPFSNIAENAVQPFHNSIVTSDGSRRQNVFPDGGTIDMLYVVSTAPGAPASGHKYDFLVGKNTVDQALTCTVLEDATSANDTSNSFTVAAPSGSTPGDDIQFQATPTGPPTAATVGFGLRYRPTTTGSFPLMCARPNSASTTLTFYYPLSGGTAAGSATEADEQSIAENMVITTMSVKLDTAPGTGASRTFTLRKNGVDTGLTCTISGTDTAATVTGSVTVADDDLLSTSAVPSSPTAPAVARPAISYLAHR
ncbi:MAG: hypothetical protein AB7H90_01500 [Alphaproteobacteria bacterium]